MAEPFWKRLPELPRSSILKWVGYFLFFIFCFVLFAYWTFPYERLRSRLIEEAADRGYEVEIIDLSPSRLSGVTLEGVRVVLPGVGEQPTVDVLLDEVTVRASWLSAISSTKSFSFDVELAGGDAEGDVAVGENDFEIDAEFSEIELRQVPALRRFTKVPIMGTLDGEIELAMPSEVGESNGTVDLTVTGMKAGDGETKVTIPGWGGLTLDEADLGNLEVVVDIEDGVADIESAKADGADIKVDLTGAITLARPVDRSRLNLMLRAKIEDAYKQKSPKVATMIDLASSGREYQAALTPDGALQYEIVGSVAGRIRPTGAGKEPFRAPTARAR